MAVGMTPDLFVQTLGLALEPTDLPARSHPLVIAHGALESGWGSSVASRLGFNNFNISAGSKWAGDVIPGPDKEPDGHGGWRRVTQRWRRYGCHYDAVTDYLAFLAAQYPTAYARLLDANPVDFVAELRAGGYFTAPLDEYTAAFAGCLARVRKLLTQGARA